MDIGINEILDEIVSGATDALATYAPVFLLIAGIVLAFGVIDRLLDFFFPGRGDTIDGNRDGARD